MRQLYFDIDGTLLVGDTGEPKAALANGVFEKAVRKCAVDQLVCVGNFIDVICAIEKQDPSYDGMGAIFSICKGVFSNESWFRETTCLIGEPEYRAKKINLAADWWYVDDLAEYYFRVAEREAVFHSHNGGRIFMLILMEMAWMCLLGLMA